MAISLHFVPGARLPGLVVQAKKRNSKTLSREEKNSPLPDANAELKPTTTPAGISSREAVYKACVTTSGGIAAAGLIIRQGSHLLVSSGYWSSDCTELIAFDLVPWHLLVAAGLVISVSGLRVVLREVWPEFAESSNAANKRVLSSLELPDCFAVSFLSGCSEEFLFRGALLPLVGMNFTGALISGTIFGALHVTGGRNVAFAAWASLVGLLYGLASVWTSDLSVPMLAHSSANLVAALLWKYREAGIINRNASSSDQP